MVLRLSKSQQSVLVSLNSHFELRCAVVCYELVAYFWNGETDLLRNLVRRAATSNACASLWGVSACAGREAALSCAPHTQMINSGSTAIPIGADVRTEALLRVPDYRILACETILSLD